MVVIIASAKEEVRQHSIKEQENLCWEEVGRQNKQAILGMKICCQCDPDYIQFQFIMVGSDGEPEAQCVVCGEVLSHDIIFSPYF